MGKRLPLVALAVAGALAVSAPAAMADTNIVTGTTVGSLSLSVTTPTTALNNLTAGSTATNLTPAAMTILSTGTWNLTVRDANFGTSASPGHLLATTPGTGTCSGSTDALASPLAFTASAATGSTITGSSGSLPSGSTGAAVASGTGSQIANIAYSQSVGTTEQLRTGCIYSVTAEYQVS
jgi:hypothetical protein